MIGPLGAEKSLLAERMKSILPEYPHHSASVASLIRGGKKSKPGDEVSLAHNGVLFLNELPEFQRSALDSLRQPPETGETSAHVSTRVKNARAQQSFKHRK
jgi:predicted ATPase with chaperone activity